jgi:hypothetical protein
LIFFNKYYKRKFHIVAISTPTPVPVGDVPGIPVQPVPLSAIDRAPDPVAVPGATGSIPVSQIDVVPDEVPVEFVPVSTSSGRQGPQGPTGPQGPAGPQGFTGATGSGSGSGSIGATGASGIQGLTGATGASGIQGLTGATGAAGTNGLDGATGLSGATGLQGDVGATGAAGTNGLDGATGLSGATGLQGDAGATGATGLQGDAGATGLQGDVGATGLQGDAGATGIAGDIGATGFTGATGPAGIATLPIANGTSNIDIATANGNVTVTTAGTNTWTFDTTGNLNLPSEGNIVGVTPNNAGRLQWLGNSSGDGFGYTTLRLIPDETLTGGDQYLIIDPTAPGHIHIRAGGTQDNSSADLFLGGENSFVKIAAGANSDVFVRSNSNDWRFGTDSVLTLPAGEGVIRTIDDTLSLVSFNTTTGNANSVYLGSGGGLGFNDQEIGGNWLEIFRSGVEPEIRVPVGRGNLNIQTASGNTPYNWTFDNTGNLTLPGSIIMAPNSGIIANGASPAPSLSGFNSLSAISISASGNISATGNVIAGNISVGGATNISNVTINSYTSVPKLWFKGQLSAAQNIVSSTDTVTLWNSNSDPLGWGNVSTGHIVPDKAGWYEITSRVQFDTNAAANSQNQINHQIAVNGSQQAISQLPNLTGNVPVTMIATAMVELNGTTDYITTTSWSSIAGNAQQINGSNASMVLVRWVSGS